VELLRDLRLGAYDMVAGINLLREGLDLPIVIVTMREVIVAVTEGLDETAV